MPSAFAIDVNRIRDEARQHLQQGPDTPSNTTDVNRVITMLNPGLTRPNHSSFKGKAFHPERTRVSPLWRRHPPRAVGRAPVRGFTKTG
jgi:hypothetical protein